MARPLRLEYAGAVYHVTSRGDRQESIVDNDIDRQLFFDVLERVVGKYEWYCHAYCLMDNHYHLLIETPHPNLSKGMRQLNGLYTQQYNRTHQRVGHVFQGRYKSILVDKDNYLLELARYIVLNPVRAKMVKHPKQWPWSSYCATQGQKPVPAYLTTDWLLGQFAKRKSTAQQRYQEFVSEGKNQASIWRQLKQQIYLGDEAFIESQLKRLKQLKKMDGFKEIPKWQRQKTAKPLDYYEGNYNDPKEAMRAAYETGQYSQSKIAKHIGVHYSSVSPVVNNRQ